MNIIHLLIGIDGAGSEHMTLLASKNKGILMELKEKCEAHVKEKPSIDEMDMLSDLAVEDYDKKYRAFVKKEPVKHCSGWESFNVIEVPLTYTGLGYI